ncbi:wiskott-Aldrich syndrome protein family member 2-like [Limulus polyphemus]|uniref:Wiskott-Aldrich syndrome protein family member n=1 Tax=Limulus polyphemus TaxID=6850 RepID=A0ABM1SKI4_LIMPO|nr:wiskott-Aldrich syndrome protein family member 2-like [Limulus polyphemus]XP_022244141.1 wiskott-Aldrich syndrome protein family member 2-like [Limulus polyphemus]
MPLLQRLIEPVHVSRGTLNFEEKGLPAVAIRVQNELEWVTNGSLSNIIRELSSLSKHADDMFGTLFREATFLVERSIDLQARIDKLAVKVTQLDSTVEEVSLQNIHLRKAFKSSVTYDQEVVARDTIPLAMKETYDKCATPPPLSKLNPYREDGKDGLKFYTDPNYFFDLWRQEMLKDTERIMLDKGKKQAHGKDGIEPHRPRPEGKRHKKVRQPHNTREKFRQMATAHEFIDKTANYSQIHYTSLVTRQSSVPRDGTDQGCPLRPSSLEIHAYVSEKEQGSPTHRYPPPPPAYTEHPQSPRQQYISPPPYSVMSPDHFGNLAGGTPTRQANRISTMRPSQPPPAPPVCGSLSSSGTSTPTISEGGTPSSGAGRYRASSHSRENLPPPPPPPEGILTNGGPSNYMVQKVLQNQGPGGSAPHTPTHNNLQSGGSWHSTPTHHPHLMNHLPNSQGHSREHTPTPEIQPGTLEHLDLPPPPPTPTPHMVEDQTAPSPLPPPPPVLNGGDSLPPPPPPLPTLEMLSDGPVMNGDVLSLANRISEMVSLSSESTSTASSNSKVSETKEVKSKLAPTAQTDARSDLLAAIREGIKLRRVEDIKQKEVEKAAPLHDVASILARRVAIEFSDSESESESEYDSDIWNDETEC